MKINTGKYDDIINMPHHVSKKHTQMSIEARSAQFAPFSALTGYNEEVKETARLTNRRIELSEEEKEMLNQKLQIIQKNLAVKPKVTITYFIPDLKKDGGIYVTFTEAITKIDLYKQLIILGDKTEIPISEIIEIEGVSLDI